MKIVDNVWNYGTNHRDLMKQVQGNLNQCRTKLKTWDIANVNKMRMMLIGKTTLLAQYTDGGQCQLCGRYKKPTTGDKSNTRVGRASLEIESKAALV